MGRVLFLEVATGGTQELLARARALKGVGGRLYTVNPRMLVAAVRDPSYGAVLSRAELCIPDGFGVARALGRRGYPTDALPGVELGRELLCAGDTLALIGARAGVAERAFLSLSRACPTARLSFSSDGYVFDVDTLRDNLSLCRPTLCYVCLGVPRQERLIDELYEASPSTLFVGLGGSLDVYAGDVRRAPRPVRRAHLEWLWRMLCEPRRLRHVGELLTFLRLSYKEERAEKCTKKSGGVSVF